MPTYMDIHEIPGGITAEEVAKAHAHDVAVEGKYGVHYHRYWVNESAGKLIPTRADTQRRSWPDDSKFGKRHSTARSGGLG